MKISKSQLRNYALLLVLPVAGIGAASLGTHSLSSLVAHGPIQQAHTAIECSSCHAAGSGSVRQQVQANLFFALGKRSTAVNFGYQPVTSEHCLICHERANDRHPIYRFNEPRFAEARQQLGVNSCFGCHSEHEDARVSMNLSACSHCHEDLVLKPDPLDVTHAQLVLDDAWSSCLGCHDFHGNHPHNPQTKVADAFHVDVILDYFKNGFDPYGSPKFYEAKSND